MPKTRVVQRRQRTIPNDPRIDLRILLARNLRILGQLDHRTRQTIQREIGPKTSTRLMDRLMSGAQDLWAYSIHSDGPWQGSFVRDDAITEGCARASEASSAVVFVAKVVSVDVAGLGPDAADVLEQAHCELSNIWREAEPLDVSPEAEQALQGLLDLVWSVWANLYGVTTSVYNVTDVELIMTATGRRPSL